jgi:hypothetical protein
MTTTITTHKRGFFGRIWQILFWLFQAIMVALIWANYSAVKEVGGDCANTACGAGVALGAGMVAATGWLVWILGTVILGILLLATRGKLVTKQIQ